MWRTSEVIHFMGTRGKVRPIFAGALLLFAVAAGGAALCLASVSREVDVPAQYGLIPSFNENFNGTTLAPGWQTAFRTDGRKPAPIHNRTLRANRERQLYVDPAFLGSGVQPFALADGRLTITANPMSPELKLRVLKELSAQPTHIRQSSVKDVGYTSGLITTLGSFQQTYGYFEIRARWTQGRGVWPTFWLLPVDLSWPPEFDVIEMRGSEPSLASQAIHSKKVKRQSFKTKLKVSSAEFHRYAMHWSADEVIFYIDGVETARAATPLDAHKPMYLLANLAVGGIWPGDPDATTTLPAKMEIDYIRAWRYPPAN